MKTLRSFTPFAFLAIAALTLTAGFGVAQQKADSKIVKLRVLLPTEDAQLYVSDKLTELKGTERNFESPPLKEGFEYVYRFRIMWEPNNYTKIYRTKNVTVKPGGSYVVDLTKPNPEKADDIKVRYVPTPQVVVDEMCKLGKVRKGDVVFDLGCGDGRFVITAVTKHGAKKGVGVDIDPDRIKDSLRNAKEAGVMDKVTFREGDVLKKINGLEEADVVMLYMGNDINLRLRPHLKKRLKPGARVVSHRFHMGDWEPDKKITVEDENGTDYDLLLWTIREDEKLEK